MISAPHEKTKYLQIAANTLAALLGFALFIYVCFFPLLPTPSWGRRLRVKQYTPDSVYSVIRGKAQVIYFEKSDEIYVKLIVEKVLLNNNSTEDYYGIGYEYEYQFIGSNRKAMEENGLKNILSDVVKIEYNGTYYDVTQTVTMTVTEGIWGDGMRPFAVGFKTEYKEYLSYETGKANLLNFFLYEMY